MNIGYNNISDDNRRRLKAGGLFGFIYIAAAAFLSSWATYIQLAPFVTPVTICIIASCMLYAIDVLQGKNLSLIGKPEIYILLYLMLVLCAVLWSLSPTYWWNFAFWWAIAVAGFCSTAYYVRTLPRLRFLVYCSALGGVVAILSLRDSVNEWGISSGRFGIDELNGNFVSYILSGTIFIIILYTKLYPIKKPKYDVVLFFIIGILIYGLLLLGTRGAMASSVAVLAWSVIGLRMSKYVSLVVFFAMIAFSIALSIGLIDSILIYFDFLSNRGTGDLSGRLQIWPEAIRYITEYPLFGIGPGAFLDVGILQVGAHNLILTVLLDTGLLGLLTMSLFFTSLLSFVRGSIGGDKGQFTITLFVLYFVPIAMSGHWEVSPFSWILLGFMYAFAKMLKQPVPANLQRRSQRAR